MQFRSGSQPNSKFQVNNNVWICRNQVQSLPERSKLGLATRLLFGLLPRFLNTQPGGTVGGSPAVSPLCLNATHNIQGRKIQLMYCTWSNVRIEKPFLCWRDLCHIRGMLSRKVLAFKRSLKATSEETTSSLSRTPYMISNSHWQTNATFSSCRSDLRGGFIGGQGW